MNSMNSKETFDRLRVQLVALCSTQPSKTGWPVLMVPITALLLAPITISFSGGWNKDIAFGLGLLQGLTIAGVFMLLLRREAPAGTVAHHPVVATDHAVLDYSQRISQSCDEALQNVIQETEQSAIEIIGRVRELDRTATHLIDYLTKADQDTLDMQTRIQQSTQIIEQISAFMQQLPARIEAERQLMERIEAIIHLSSRVAKNVQDISRQTHMVAFNILIQAAHMGKQGRSLTVVADEVRHLSQRSSEAADLVVQAVHDIKGPMSAYTSEFQRDFTQHLQEAVRVTESVHELQAGYEDMKQYYKTLLTVIKDHNSRMADAIVDTLGNIQYQDVVRQRLERVLAVQVRYREVVQTTLDEATPTFSSRVQEELAQVLNDYLEAEYRHGQPQIDDLDGGSPRIELF